MSEAPSNPQSNLGSRVLIALAWPAFALVALLLGNLFRPAGIAPDVSIIPSVVEATSSVLEVTATHTLNAVEIAYTEIAAGNATREAQEAQPPTEPVVIAQVASPTQSIQQPGVEPSLTPSFTAVVVNMLPTFTPTITPSQTAAVPSLTPSYTAVMPLPSLTPLPPSRTPTAMSTLAPTQTLPPQSSATPLPPSATPSFTPVVPSATPSHTPTVPPAQPSAIPARAEGATYIVQAGDTLFQIAARHNTTVEAIYAANNLNAADYIFPGQALLLPETTASGVSTPALPIPTGDVERIASPAVPLTRMPTAEPLGMLPTVVVAPPLPPDVAVNGVEDDDFVWMPDQVVRNVRRIYAQGQAMGRNPHAFTRIGDSTIEMPHFFTRFDGDDYHLGEYGYLQGVIDYYAGSFNHDSRAVKRGLHTWSVFDPQWADGCGPQEHMLACEFRLHNPSIILVRLGSNDRGVPDSTDRNLREIVEYAIAQGVIPVMGTKADRFDGPSNINNTLIRRIAQEYELPLWDFDLVANTLPGRGLGPDNVHMTFFYAHDWRQAGGFQTGHGVHNLTGLIMLDAVWRVLITEAN